MDGGTLLATVLTGWDGRYSLCFANVPAGRNVSVVIITKNVRWRVQETGTINDFYFGAGTHYVADVASVEIGPLVPADRALDRGLSAFDSANAAWNWKPGSCWDLLDAPAACWQAVINWSPTSIDGTYYNGQVHLTAADPDAPIVDHRHRQLRRASEAAGKAYTAIELRCKRRRTPTWWATMAPETICRPGSRTVPLSNPDCRRSSTPHRV